MILLNLAFSSVKYRTTWSKYGDAPILLPGIIGSWDDFQYSGGSLTFKDNKFHFWYGVKNSSSSWWQIGYATSDFTLDISQADISLPNEFKLQQNYPNPFNPYTLIEYSLPTQEYVQLKIFSLLGEEIIKLVDGIQSSGLKRVFFDGTNLSSGIYTYQLVTGKFAEAKK